MKCARTANAILTLLAAILLILPANVFSAAAAQESDGLFYILTGSKTLEVSLADSAAAREIYDLLDEGDITVDMTGNSFEQYGELGRSLPSNDSVITAQPGDVLLYKSDTICVFYGTNRYSYTRLGKIVNAGTEELKELLSAGDLTFKLTKHPASKVIFEPKEGSTTEFYTVDDVNYICGITAGLTAEEFLNEYVISMNADISFSGKITTGTAVTVADADSGIIAGEYILILFGDVDSDGLYDARDSLIINCLANGMLSKEQVGKAFFAAADCSQDGIIDNSDVVLAEQAGLMLTQINQSKKENSEMKLKMYINNTPVTVDWENNDSVTALMELCADSPLTINMSMYGGFEQVGSIGQNLPRDDKQTTTSSGDIVLYSGNQIVVFYGSNSWAYTRLGHITDKNAAEMRALLGNGNVTIKLALEEE